jgi:hypothetical protein
MYSNGILGATVSVGIFLCLCIQIVVVFELGKSARHWSARQAPKTMRTNGMEGEFRGSITRG